MKEGKTDRRVKYTRMMLKDALVQLMQKQHISSISIKSLCETADINRSTFYAHFSDQYDLLHYIVQEVMASLNRDLEQQEFTEHSPVSAQVLTRILEYAKANADLFKALLSENCDYALQRDIMQLSQIISSQLNRAPDPRTQEYLLEFGITGCISVLHKWLQEGMIESPAEMSEFIIRVLYHGIISYPEDEANGNQARADLSKTNEYSRSDRKSR